MADELGPIDIKLTASGISEVIASFKNLEDRVISLEQKMTQASQKGAKDRTQAAKNESSNKVKEFDKSSKDFEKSEKDKTKIAEREAKKREQATSNYFMAEKRFYEKQNKEIESLSNRLAGRIVNNFRQTVGHVTRIFGTLLSLGGGISVAQSYSREMAISRAAQNAALVTQIPGKPGEAVSASDLESKARQTAKEFNVHPEDVLASEKELMSKSSMGSSVLKLMPEIIKLAKAENTGQEPAEFQNQLARTVGILIKQGNNPNHVMTMLRGMVGQGRAAGGTVEFSELANVIPRISSKAGLYEGNKEGNVMKLQAMTQAAFMATGDVSEAATGVERISDDIIKDYNKGSKSKMTRLLGHAAMRGGKIMDPMELIPELFGKAGGDIGKLENSGLNVRSNRVLLGYLDTYQKAEANKKGSGEDAVRKSMVGEVGAQLSKSDVDKDYEDRRRTSAEQSEKVWNDFDQAIRDKLIPTITTELIPALAKMIPAFEQLLTGLSKLITFISGHKMEAAFLAVGGLIGKSIIGGVLSMLAKEVVANGIRGALPTAGAIPAAAGAFAGPAAAAVTGLGIGAIMDLHELSRIDDAKSKGKDLARQDIENVKTLTEKKKKGEQLTDEEQDQLDLAENHKKTSQKIMDNWKSLGGAKQTAISIGAAAHIGSAQKSVEDETSALAYQQAISEQSIADLKEASKIQLLAAQKQLDAASGNNGVQPGPNHSRGAGGSQITTK